MAHRIIVNADDFGITRGASDAIVECHQHGSVTSTTWMANMTASEYAADLAVRMPSLGVGLHFNLTQGRPLAARSAVSSLVDSRGDFCPRLVLASRAAAGRIRAEHVRVELAAQLERMRSLGLTPTHLDSHQHVHALPVVFSQLVAAARGAGVFMRMPWRWQGHSSRTHVRRRARSWCLEKMLQVCEARHGLAASNDGFCSVFDLALDARSLSLGSYERLLRPYYHGVTELMVHPAIVDEELRTKTDIVEVSRAEHRLLCSEGLSHLIESRGGRLTHYGELA